MGDGDDDYDDMLDRFEADVDVMLLTEDEYEERLAEWMAGGMDHIPITENEALKGHLNIERERRAEPQPLRGSRRYSGSGYLRDVAHRIRDRWRD